MPLSPEEGDGVYTIPSGSFIYHLDGGVTKVYGPDKVLLFAARDSEAAPITTPAGQSIATRVFQVPSESRIHDAGNNITEIYDKDGTLILTIVDQSRGDSGMQIPAPGDWIEDSYDWSIANLDLFQAIWDVPSAPPDPGASAVDFLFNGVEPDTAGKIIQPVLEWNQAGSGRWTGRAWAVWPGGSATGNPINVSQGDEIEGTLSYGSGQWMVNFADRTTSQNSIVYDDHISSADLAVSCALEGKNIDDDDDVPGDTTSDNMSFMYNYQDIDDIEWSSYTDDDDNFPNLTGLSVTIHSDSKVTLNTAN